MSKGRQFSIKILTDINEYLIEQKREDLSDQMMEVLDCLEQWCGNSYKLYDKEDIAKTIKEKLCELF